jgi:hypothetical protein
VPLPDALIAEVRQHKADILDLLRAGGAGVSEGQRPSESTLRTVEAAVEGWRWGVARLGSMPRPQGYPERAWTELLSDAEHFLECWGMQAARLGWQDWELFGCYRRAPFHRIQGMGLVLLLRGNSIAALTETEAVIRTQTGARQTYRRKPVDPLGPAEGSPIWQLS